MSRTGGGQIQFSLKSLFAVIAYVAIFLPTAIWVMDRKIPTGSWELPVLFYPSLRFTGFGVIVVPFLSLSMVIASFVLTIRSYPRAVTNYYYFACVLLLLGVSPDTPNTVRWLASLCVGSSAFVIETLIRKLPKRQIVAALLAVGATAGAYVFILSAVC